MIVQLCTGSPGLSYEKAGAVAYIESGALLTKLANSSLNVDVTVADYVSIVGSPNYDLPVSTTTADYISVVGSPNYDLPVIGSVEVGNTVTVDGTVNIVSTIADYMSVVGSPNYDLPVIGSVEVSNTVTVDATNLDIRDLTAASDSVKISDGTNTAEVEAQGALSVAVNEYYSTFGSNFAADQANTMLLAGVVGSQTHVSDIFVSTDNNTTDVFMSFNSTATTTPVHVIQVEGANKASTNVDRHCHIVGPTDGSVFITCGSGTFVALNYAYYTP